MAAQQPLNLCERKTFRAFRTLVRFVFSSFLCIVFQAPGYSDCTIVYFFPSIISETKTEVTDGRAASIRHSWRPQVGSSHGGRGAHLRRPASFFVHMAPFTEMSLHIKLVTLRGLSFFFYYLPYGEET